MRANSGSLAQVELAVGRQGAVDHLQDAAGPRRHDDDPGAEIDGLGDRVGDEDDGLAGAAPEPVELVVEMIAGDLVEGAEGLVHEQEGGVEGERAGNRHPLLHAAGELPGIFPLEAGEAHDLEPGLGALSGAPRQAGP